ncbi:MAG TPA: F0F1 ATP synthase subunit B [Thermoflexia bacterium]|jgi:F-type H+-transporting ATPase subunit b|nr:F0F1 ATP synthase subunit B [Thermoflexia bacterium]
MERLGINPWILLAQIVNFIVLVVILRAVAYKPLQKMLKERQERIQKGLEDAKAAEEARARAEEEREEILTEARAEADRILAEARRKAREEAEKVLSQAREEAEGIRATARKEAELERAQILGQVREEIAALAIAAAHKLIGEALDEQRQRALVDAFFSGIREGRVEVLPEGVERADGPVTVTSAVPLTEAEKETIRRELTARLGDEVEVSFEVDPQILGGLVVRIGDRVVDGSFAGQLEQLRETLA